MRIFVAGASGVIGIRLVPLLVAGGHEVAGMTRTPEKAAALRDLGADGVVCDVFDARALERSVAAFGPEMVIQQLTDLPDEASKIAEFGSRNDRMRQEGTRNLLAAAQGAGAKRFLAQSIAWDIGGERGEATRRFERQVLDANGVVIRYGQLYGPGTYYEDAPPAPPRVHVDEAARRTVGLLDADAGVVEVVEPEGS
jgi:nucleoside-diphosphate-sugar epimerase